MENTTHLSLARPEDVKTKLKTYLNEELLKNRYVYFNPGSHTKTVKMRATDLLNVLENPIRFT